jgi:hypothetical protein
VSDLWQLSFFEDKSCFVESSDFFFFMKLNHILVDYYFIFFTPYQYFSLTCPYCRPLVFQTV